MEKASWRFYYEINSYFDQTAEDIRPKLLDFNNDGNLDIYKRSVTMVYQKINLMTGQKKVFCI